jgi:RNA polymerase sigma-70 factor (ECF subfamily)
LTVREAGSDAEVIRDSVDHPELFAVIFERHYRRVYRLVVAAVGPSDGADLASEVFVRAFALRRRYQVDRESAWPWLGGIASNLVSDYFRKAARRERAYRRATAPFEFEPDHSEDAVDRVASVAARPHITSAFEHVRPEDAQVFLLFAVGDLSYAEIASALGIAEGTVRSRLSRTRDKLRNLLADDGESINDDE